MKAWRTLPLMVLMAAMHAFGQNPYIQQVKLSGPASESRLQAVSQDSRGYIWLGANDGLYRFDGMATKKYFPPGDSVSYSVTCIAEDASGVIWTGCKDGSVYYLEKGSPRRFSPEEGTGQATVSDILADKDQTIWWATSGEGIYLYRDGRMFNINREDGLADDYVYDLEEGKDGGVWAATDGGVAFCSFRNGNKGVKIPVVNDSFPDILVKKIKKDHLGRLVLGFQDAGTGILFADGSSFLQPVSSRNWNYGSIEDLVVFGDRAWAGTMESGLVEISLDEPGMPFGWDRDSQGNPLGKIRKMMQDSEGNIWLLTSDGLFRSPGPGFNYLLPSPELPLREVHAILADKQERLWFSTEDGLFCKPSREHAVRYLKDRPGLKIMSLEEDDHGFIWAGTFDHGVFRIDPASGIYRQVMERDGLINNNVLSISCHRDTLWLATLGGASRIILSGSGLDGKLSFTSFNHENGLVNNFIYAIFEDSHDRIWFGTDGAGLSVWNGDRFRTYAAAEGIRDEVIYSITEDGEGNIWFSTAGDGIYRFDGNSFTRYGAENGLGGLDITSMAASGDELLVVHSDGLDVFNTRTGKIVRYGEEIGLQQDRPELNAICRDREGNIWIGTRGSIIRYQPGVRGRLTGPVTVIDEMLVFMQPVEMEAGGISLPGNQNHITLNYAGFWHTDPARVLYQVMLDGYDLGWKATFDRTMTFSSLPAGKYTFMVRSSLDPTFTNASMASYSFEIRKPLLASPWFIILITFVVAGLGYLIVRYREQKLRETEQRKKEKVEFEFQVLKNQVNPHFLFNSFSTLIALIEEQPSMAIEYTEKLSDFFRTILQYKDTAVIPLSEELELIDNYLFIQKKRYGDNLDLQNTLGEEENRSLIPPLTLQMLTENAIKHNVISREKPLIIKIYHQGTFIVVENALQPKKQAEPSTGIGLENIVKRYSLLTDRKPYFERTAEVYRVWLPLINDK